MKSVKDEYREYTSEYLLELRARGEHLSQERHKLIEEVFAERNEKLPNIPLKPIFHTKQQAKRNASKTSIKYKVIFFIGLLLSFAIVGVISQYAKILPELKLALIVITVFIVIYLISSKKSIFEDSDKSDEFTPLILCSINGDLNAARELIALGADIDELSSKGNTALIYAVRNNHLDLVKLFLENGANKGIISSRNLTAHQTAVKHSFNEIANYIENYGK